MNEGRILQLKQFIKEDENDYFSIYALALEHKLEDPLTSIQYLESIRSKNPEYIALYYHLAELYIETDQIEKAKSTFESGILIIEKTKDSHALKELKNAFQNFLFEYE